MTYTASEIIERAKNLADAGNTDYLTFKEATQYLNDAYNYVYQKAISGGSSYFLKTLTMKNGEAALPSDFYQLAYIKDPFSGYLVQRKARNASLNEPGYSMVNNTLKVDGCHAFEVAYYPTPTYITIHAKEEATSLKEADAVWHNIAVKSTEDGFSIYDWYNDAVVNVASENKYDHYYVSNTFLIAVGEDRHDIYNFDGELLSTGAKALFIRQESGVITATPLGEDNKISYKGHTVKLELTPDEYLCATDRYIYYTSNKSLYCQQIEDTEATFLAENVTQFMATRINHKSGVAFFDGTLPKVYSTAWDYIDTVNIDYNSFIGFYDNRDGYGMLYSDGVTIYKSGYLPETVFNYPNNNYYTLIAYIIATYLVAKQGGDVTILAAQKEKAEQAFADDDRDGFMAVRIKNVY